MAFFSTDLFPTTLSFFVFISYMGLFINQGILVTASKSEDNSYSYNTVTVVLLTEVTKLVASTLLFIKDHSIKQLFADIVTYKRVLFLYLIPAALYCLYNNLQFVNLSAYDPTTYYLLLQFRVVVTGITFQLVFKKKLSRIQWMSLTLLTVGCIIKEVRHDVSSAETLQATPTSVFDYLDIHMFFIMLQLQRFASKCLWTCLFLAILVVSVMYIGNNKHMVFSSCFAGVYNEFLLKDTGADVHIMMANVFMYINSIVCNVLLLAVRGQLSEAFIFSNLDSIMKPRVVAIIINNAAIGIVTSLFLRSLNSILKTFASALELMFTAVLCWFIFGIPVDTFTILAIFIVSAATYIYAQNPVVNKARSDIELDFRKKTEIDGASSPDTSSPGHRHKLLLSA